jgi:hypothetical protein
MALMSFELFPTANKQNVDLNYMGLETSQIACLRIKIITTKAKFYILEVPSCTREGDRPISLYLRNGELYWKARLSHGKIHQKGVLRAKQA